MVTRRKSNGYHGYPTEAHSLPWLHGGSPLVIMATRRNSIGYHGYPTEFHWLPWLPDESQLDTMVFLDGIPLVTMVPNRIPLVTMVTRRNSIGYHGYSTEFHMLTWLFDGIPLVTMVTRQKPTPEKL